MKKRKILTLILSFIFIASTLQAEFGDEAIFISDVLNVDEIQTLPMSQNRFVTVYVEQTGGSTYRLFAKVGTLNADLSLTYGTEIVLSDTNQVSNISVARLSDSQFVVFFERLQNYQDQTYTFLGTIQGSGINATIRQDLREITEFEGFIAKAVIAGLSETQWMIVYNKKFRKNEVNGWMCCARTATLESDSIRLGKAQTVSELWWRQYEPELVAASWSATKFIIGRYDENQQMEHQVVIGNIINADSLTFGQPETFFNCTETSDECQEFKLLTLEEDKFVIGYYVQYDDDEYLSTRALPFVKAKSSILPQGRLAFKPGSVSGSNITLGDENVLINNSIDALTMAKIDDSRFVVAFDNRNLLALEYMGIIAVVGEINGNTLTWHSKMKCSNAIDNADEPNALVLNGDKLILSYEYFDDNAEEDKENSGRARATALGNMTYTTSTVVQKDKVIRGYADQTVVQIKIEVDGQYNPLNATRFECNLNGTTNATDITEAKLWSSEWAKAIVGAEQVGDSVTNFNGNFVFEGNVPLATGTNYFWLTCDIAEDAELGNLADGECVSATIDGTPRTPETTAPTGGAEISMPRTFLAANATLYPDVNGLYIQSGVANNKPYYKNTKPDTSRYLYYIGMGDEEYWIIGTSLEIMDYRYIAMNESGANFDDPPETGWMNPDYDDFQFTLTVTEVFENSLIYSGTNFNEAAANDGSIDNTTPITVTYMLPRNNNSFVGTNGENLASGNKITADNLPAGLTAVVTRQNDTTATITLTGKATAHEDTNSVYDVKFTFTDDVFTLGQSKQIHNSEMDSLSINFSLMYAVQGAGSDGFNGVYSGSGLHNGKRKFVKDASHLIYHTETDGQPLWIMSDALSGGDTYYYVQSDADTLPSSGWNIAEGSSPAPTVFKVGPPRLKTNTASEVTAGSVTCGGTILSNGGSAITERGICWSTSENPTVDDDSKICDTSADTFSVSLTELSRNTTYHVRAYAINEMGTGYGSDISFTTEKIKIFITPSDTLVRGNQSFTYQVKAENVYPGMRGFEVKVALDTAAFSSVNFSEGSFLNRNGATTQWELLENGGNYTADCAILGTTDGKIGDGTLFTISVTTKTMVTDSLVSSEGDNFTITSVKFRDVNNQAITYDSTRHSKIVVDTGRPSMETISETEEVWYRLAPTFANFGFDDNYNLDKVEYRVNNENWETVEDSISSATYDDDKWEVPGFDNLADQTELHKIYWRAYDDAGNFNGFMPDNQSAAGAKNDFFARPTLKPDLDRWSWSFKKDVTAPTGQHSIEIDNVTSTSMVVNATQFEDATQGEEYYEFKCTTNDTFSRARVKDDYIHECTSMIPNTKYTFKYRASDGVNDPNAEPTYNVTSWSSEYTKCTLSVAPTTSTVTCNKNGTCSTTTLTFTAVGGFGAGKVQYYRYVLSDCTTYTWNESESQWNSGTLKLGIPTANKKYYLHVKGYNAEDAANGTLVLGPYQWDGTPICEISGLDLNASENSLSFGWTNPEEDAYKIQVWIKPYGGYPEYTGTVPKFPTTPSEASQFGWENISSSCRTSLKHKPDDRDFYYVAVFVEDRAEHFSCAVSDSSLSYWLGDVNDTPDGEVNASDIAILASAYYTRSGESNWNAACDVGPTLDAGRTSRPEPDDFISFEDLMIFAMNYERTGSDQLKKPKTETEIQPITLKLNVQNFNTDYLAQIQLEGNESFVKGLEIPVSFGADISILSVGKGDVLSGNDFFHSKQANQTVSISAAALNESGVFAGDGVVANIVFQVNGTDVDFQFGEATARTATNAPLEVSYNYTDVALLPENLIPTEYKLHQNFPNPFNPSTTIRYDLKESGHVKISLFNINGQQIMTLLDEEKNAGYHSFLFETDRLSSGVYIYKIEVNNFSEIKKLTLVK